MLQIGELISDLIQAFGFHWRSFLWIRYRLLRLYPSLHRLRRANRPGCFPCPRESPMIGRGSWRNAGRCG
jgi:hypothetical protein